MLFTLSAGLVARGENLFLYTHEALLRFSNAGLLIQLMLLVAHGEHREEEEAMKHDEFIGQMQYRARLSSRGAAERATRATLETLAERLAGGEARDLAAQLPPEIGEMDDVRAQLPAEFARLFDASSTGQMPGAR